MAQRKRKPMMKTIACRIPAETFQAMEELAKILEWTISDVIRSILVKHIELKGYWKNITETLRAMGLPESEVQRAFKLFINKKTREKYVKVNRD